MKIFRRANGDKIQKKAAVRRFKAQKKNANADNLNE